MVEIDVLRAIAQVLRHGNPFHYSDEVASALGLTWDRWYNKSYAGYPEVAGPAMANFLDSLARRLGDERVQLLLAEIPALDEVLAEQCEKLDRLLAVLAVGDGA